MKRFSLIVFSVLFMFSSSFTNAQRKRGQKRQEPKSSNSIDLSAFKFRNVGPAFLSGRIADIAIHPTNENTWYVAVGSGGLWKTENAGTTWSPLFDKQSSYSTGCVTIDSNNPSTIWLGTGENVGGRHVAYGDGVYKSTDGGDTWKHMGLDRTRQISRVRVHPTDHNIVYVGAQGSPYGANKERGVYRSKDGGETWDLVLHVDENTGVSDLTIDVTNPRVLYAAFWEHRRYPWIVDSGGENSAIYKSVDGGDTWEKLTNGLPKFMGKIGVVVSPANNKRVWAIIEAEDGGLFRSDDAGKSWTNINKERILRI